jgi:hypothetical protein
LAVEAVIGEPSSTELPENSEFTGNFPTFAMVSTSKIRETPAGTPNSRARPAN